MSDNRDWQADMKYLRQLNDWELDPDDDDLYKIALYWLQQYAAEKAQVDYWREATRQGNIELEAAEAREKKLIQNLKSYMPHMWPAMAAHFEVLLDAMYPKEGTE